MISNWQSPLRSSLGEASPLRGGTRQGLVSHPPVQISPQMSRGLPHQHHTTTHTHTNTHTHTHFDPPPTLFVMKSNTWKRRSGRTTCASNCSAFAGTQERRRRERRRRGRGRGGERGEESKTRTHTHSEKKKGVQEIVRKKKGFKVSHVHMNETWQLLLTWSYNNL